MGEKAKQVLARLRELDAKGIKLERKHPPKERKPAPTSHTTPQHKTLQ